MLEPMRTNRFAMNKTLAWSTQVDEKDISDAAREWAEKEIEVTAFPEDKGALAGALEMAFEAGRFYQQICRGNNG